MKLQTFLTIIFLTIIGLFVSVFLIIRRDENVQPGNSKEVEQLSQIAHEIQTEDDLDILIAKTEDKKYVLLGESSHGTKEYYTWRANISKRLIEENNFSYIAIEGNFPNIYHTNRYVKGMDGTTDTALKALTASLTWPEWMWANEEFLELVEWVRGYNSELPIEKRVGIYGMDMQNLNGSIEQSINALNIINPNLSQQASQYLECFKEFNGDFFEYAKAYNSNSISCEDNVKSVLEAFENIYSENDISSNERLFKIHQNLLAIKFGEQYSRDLLLQGSQSWNTRVKFMKNFVNSLSLKYGDSSKGIIWAHNTHVGDASATEMQREGIVNIGQLLRERYSKENIFILGFGTYHGTVIASSQWGNPLQVLDLPSAREGSIESFLNRVDIPSYLFFLNNGQLPNIFSERVGHRAKGVVYNPRQDYNNYVQTVLSERYDAFIFIQQTSALTPIAL